MNLSRNLPLQMAKHSPTALRRAYLEAAEAARKNPYFTPDFGEERAREYLAEAEKLEAFA